MSPGQPVGTVQESKAKRQERLKSRFRDRGGYVLSLNSLSVFPAFSRV
jgi:hypothetical protein